MRIGVLNCGPVARAIAPRYGEYDRVFRDWLGPHDPSLEFSGWNAHLGELPDTPSAADGWILSGSKYGVYEGHDWIEPLKGFIRGARDARSPMIGVCFGHQIMAEALGGRAEKWKNGWNLGPKTYRANGLPRWMSGAPEAPALHAIHQDQVTVAPPDATTIYAHDDCAHAALLYGDPEAPYGVSIQPHPEFSDEFTGSLLDLRRGVSFPEDRTDAASAAIGQPLARDWAAGWFIDYLKRMNA